MEQSVELMRKRHAYYTNLIAEYNIHTALEFCEKLGEMFAMFGVEINLNAEAPDTATISITCEDYDYEDYTIHDGVDGGLATIDNIVAWKPHFCDEETDIFSIDEYQPPKLDLTMNREKLKELFLNRSNEDDNR